MTERLNVHALNLAIKQKEKELFDLKRKVEDNKRTIHGKIIIDPPNQYNCKTCHNKSCIFHPSMFRQKDFVAPIRAFTVLYGCLSWLPEKEQACDVGTMAKCAKCGEDLIAPNDGKPYWCTECSQEDDKV